MNAPYRNARGIFFPAAVTIFNNCEIIDLLLYYSLPCEQKNCDLLKERGNVMLHKHPVLIPALILVAIGAMIVCGCHHDFARRCFHGSRGKGANWIVKKI